MPADQGRIQETASQRIAEHIVASLARAMRNVSFYEVKHPVVTGILDELVSVADVLLADSGEFLAKLSQGYVVVQDEVLRRTSEAIGNFIGACNRRDIETIRMRRGMTASELTHLIEVLSLEPQQLEAMGGPAQVLASRGVKHISIEKLITCNGDEGETAPSRPLEWSQVYMAALDVVRNAAAEVRTGKPVDIYSVHTSVRQIVDNLTSDGSIVQNLSWMKDVDEYTFVHSLHICVLATELARVLGFPRPQMEEICPAALLHDLGKIFVPLEILRKPGKLSEEEFNIISQHPVEGALALACDEGVPEVASVVAYEHHIHADHSGYPKMCERRPLHMYSLMTSIADIYDALTTARPYRPALTPLTALAMMRSQMAALLEPRLFAQFREMLGPYPCGTMLRVADGRLVVVTRTDPGYPDNPLVRLIGEEGERSVQTEEVALRAVVSTTTEITEVDPTDLGIDLVLLMRRCSDAAGQEGQHAIRTMAVT